MAWVLAAGLGLLATGCATSRIDWDSRVGNFSYDQAVIEFGPPDKEAMLTDGTRVTEWLVRRGYSSAYVGGVGRYGYPYHAPYGPGPYSYYEPGAPDRWVRLTFDPDGTLVSWKKVAR